MDEQFVKIAVIISLSVLFALVVWALIAVYTVGVAGSSDEGPDYVDPYENTAQVAAVPGTILTLDQPVATITSAGVYPLEACEVPGGQTKLIKKDVRSLWSGLGTIVVDAGAVCVLNNGSDDIFIGGTFTGGVQHWDGSSWTVLVSANPLVVGTEGVLGLAFENDNKLNVIIVGEFASPTGVTNGANVILWTRADDTFAAMSSTADASAVVRCVGVNYSSGSVYIGGDFVDLDNVTGADGMAEWDSTNTTWLLVGDTATTTALSGVNTMVVDESVDAIYIGGTFGAFGSVTDDTGFIAVYTGGAWATVAAVSINGTTTYGLSGPVSSLVIDTADETTNWLYISGAFATDASGTNVLGNIARFDTEGGSIFTSMGGVDTANVSLTIDDELASPNNGIVYISGNFVDLGPNKAQYAARWNETDWYPLGDTLTDNTPFDLAPLGIHVLTDSTVLAVGTSGMATLGESQGVALWATNNVEAVINGAFVTILDENKYLCLNLDNEYSWIEQ